MNIFLINQLTIITHLIIFIYLIKDLIADLFIDLFIGLFIDLILSAVFFLQLFQIILRQDIGYLHLADRQILLVFQDLAHGFGIFGFVSLCAQRMDCGTFGYIEHLGLDKGLVNILAHLAAQGVDFPDQMALGRTAYMGIAGHHGDAVDIHRENDCTVSKAGTGKGCLTAGMSGTDHTYVSVYKVIH